MQLFRDFYHIIVVKLSVLNSQIQANIYLLRYICSVISDIRRSAPTNNHEKRSFHFSQTLTSVVVGESPHRTSLPLNLFIVGVAGGTAARAYVSGEAHLENSDLLQHREVHVQRQLGLELVWE